MKINKNQLGKGIYTEDNLVAGTNISLDQVQISGGIDANTIACMHFEDNLNDSSQYASTREQYSTSVDYLPYCTFVTGKFGKALTRYAYTGSTALEYQNYQGYYSNPYSKPEDTEATIDFWLYGQLNSSDSAANSNYIRPGIYTYGHGSTPWLGLQCSSKTSAFFFYLDKAGTYVDVSTELRTKFNQDEWNHIALCWKKNEYIKIYVNGSLCYTEVNTSVSFTYGIVGYQVNGVNLNTTLPIDELRISNVVRYTGNFAPPTAPYTSGSTTVTAVNNTMSAPSVMTGATSSTAGTSGLVPAPAAGDQAKYLTGAGTWETPASGGSAPTLTWYKNNTGTTVTISDTSSANLVKVYKNGILLEPTEDYSISGTTLTMVTALVATDKIAVEVF